MITLRISGKGDIARAR